MNQAGGFQLHVFPCSLQFINISSTNFFSAPFFHLSFGDSHYVYVGVYLVTIHLIVSHRSLQLYIFLVFSVIQIG